MPDRQTPREILSSAGKLDKDVIAVRYRGRTVDLHTPIEATAAELAPVRASDPDGLAVIRHSTAHVMADAVQRLFPGTKVTIGPAIDDGFYYDFDKPGGGFTDDDLRKIEQTMREVVQRELALPARRRDARRGQAHVLVAWARRTRSRSSTRSPPDEEVCLYRHGAAPHEWVDVCEGPHVPATGFLKAVEAHARRRRVLARRRAQPDAPAHLRHRVPDAGGAGGAPQAARGGEGARPPQARQGARALHVPRVRPGDAVLLARGARSSTTRMVDYMRGLYERDGYEEVITPQIFDPKLFRTSGHLGHYNENMYRAVDRGYLEKHEKHEASGGDGLKKGLQDDAFGLKPMNCPSHCVIFGASAAATASCRGAWPTSAACTATSAAASSTGWRACGASPGRRAHLLRGGPGRAARSRSSFGSSTRCTRPFGSRRSTSSSRRAHARQAHRERRVVGQGRARRSRTGSSARAWPTRSAPGEGAFYGPKIEFHVQDALKRSWQLGTIQYDPNLPERFGLEYVGEDGKEHRPVMLHRAIFGSLERFFAVYLEHCGGSFPAWLAPEQAVVLTVSEKSDEYARQVVERAPRQGSARRGRLLERQARGQDPQRAALRATRTCSSWGRRRPRPTRSASGRGTRASSAP